MKIEPKNLTKMITFYSEKNQSKHLKELNKQSSVYKTFILDISAIGVSLIDSLPREILHVELI